MASNESKIPVGQILVGKYRVVREIGRGGMAAVYEAEQLSLGKKVAVKVLAAELSASTIVIERFFREARAAASVRSPYIVDVYDSGRLDDGRPFIAMELLEGESLYDRMARVRIIDVETTVRCVVHTAKGLVKAHAAGIVHRDLKPENIFLTKGEDGDDLCKILDFGLAKFYEPVNPEGKAAKRLTREGAVFGTPAYMSPEQVKGQGSVDHRADLWALGCMAFECLIGRPVWNMDQGVAMTFAAIATGPIPVPSQIRTDLPREFDAWFAKCLQRDPNARYQSAKELADAFILAWGQRPGSSSASFPNVVLGSSGKYSPAHLPAAAPGAGGEELAGDPGQGRAPPAPLSARGSPGGGLDGNGQRAGSVGSDASMPLPLLSRSPNDTPSPISQTGSRGSQPRGATSPVRVAMSAVFLAASISTAIFVWVRFLHPQVFAPVVQSTASAQPTASTNASGGDHPSSAYDEPKWVSIIAEGQRLFTANDVGGAQKKFQEAIALGGPAATVGKVFADQLKDTKAFTGPCKPVSFSRPRLSWDRKGERPAIIALPKGSLVTWVDDHEQRDKDHVYGVVIDGTGRSTGPIRDLTPEATDAQRPQLVGQGDRNVLLWADTKGSEAGVHVRYLDGEGRIDPLHGQSVRVNGVRTGDFWPVIEKTPNGFLVAWQEDKDKDKDYDLFARLLTNDLGTTRPEVRLTDYNVPPKSKTPVPKVRLPSVAVAPGTVFFTYRLDDDRKRIIVRERVPLDELERANAGLLESKDPQRSTRVTGDVDAVSDAKLPGDAPAIACGQVGCFVVWHGEPNGAWVALIDPVVGKWQWRKKFSDRGGHPSLAVNEGQVALAYYESGRVKMAYLNNDGVQPVSTLLRVHDINNPRPSLAAGTNKNEWSIAWQDSDTPRGGPEVYASRVVCAAR
jgi:serine/threonine-protein kinase